MSEIVVSFAQLRFENFDVLGDGDLLALDELEGVGGSNQIRDRNFMALVGAGDASRLRPIPLMATTISIWPNSYRWLPRVSNALVRR